MSRHPSLVHEVLCRFDTLKAFGTSRHDLKAEQRNALRVAGKPTSWSHSTGRIHSFGTADTYKRHTLAYCSWARAVHGVHHLADLDARAAELVPLYLRGQLEAGKSPYTVQMLRSALRMFHQDHSLGGEVAIPRRRREDIRRSRGETASDRRINPDRYHDLIAFLQATGLRRREAQALRVKQIVDLGAQDLAVEVINRKGGKARTVVVNQNAPCTGR